MSRMRLDRKLAPTEASLFGLPWVDSLPTHPPTITVWVTLDGFLTHPSTHHHCLGYPGWVPYPPIYPPLLMHHFCLSHQVAVARTQVESCGCLKYETIQGGIWGGKSQMQLADLFGSLVEIWHGKCSHWQIWTCMSLICTCALINSIQPGPAPSYVNLL